MNGFLAGLAAAALLSAGTGPPPREPAHPLGRGLVSLISTDDYPLAALRADEQGNVTVRLDIDAAGSVSACTVVQSSGSASLDAATCALLRERARFSPARDRRGRPVPDTYSQTVNWRISPKTPLDTAIAGAVQPYLWCLAKAVQPLADGPASFDAIADQAFAACTDTERAVKGTLAGMPAPAGASPWPPDLRRLMRQTVIDVVRFRREGPREHVRPVVGKSLAGLISAADYPPSAIAAGEQGGVRVRLEVDENGRPTGCRVIESSGFESLDTATCRLLQERARFTPARDRQGKPIADIFFQRIAWRLTEPDQEPAVEAALGRWSSCLYDYAAEHAADSVDVIGERAFATCRSFEPALVAALNAAPGNAAPLTTVPQSLRDDMRQQLLETLLLQRLPRR
ncbi:MAG: energy transducer TonB [Alphaproteobacteria bacterium]|nr:energy transducer TonB [Alphaproteobacteria bacterium]